MHFQLQFNTVLIVFHQKQFFFICIISHVNREIFSLTYTTQNDIISIHNNQEEW